MCYCENPSFFNAKTITARKQHECCECGTAIMPGDQYRSSTGCWGGNVDTFKQCLDCRQVFEDCRKLSDCPCEIAFGFLDDEVREYRLCDYEILNSEVADRMRSFCERLDRARAEYATTEERQ